MPERWARAGLVVNPTAGRGPTDSLTAARQTIERLAVSTVLTGAADTGASALQGWSGTVATHDVRGELPTQRTRALARWLAGQRVDVLVVVGGDGTLADAALDIGPGVPVLGVGAGSTNVGTLVTCRCGEVEALDVDRLEPVPVDALVAAVNGNEIGVAFNDVVLAATVVGTLDGRRIDIDAAEKRAGRTVPGVPRPVGGPVARVVRVHGGQRTPVAEGAAVGTVVVGFAEPAFFGKAVAGAACLTTLAGLPAGCLVCDVPLAYVGAMPTDLAAGAAVASRYVSLADGAVVEVVGMDRAAVVCVDGNPLHLFGADDRVTIGPRTGAVTAVRVRR